MLLSGIKKKRLAFLCFTTVSSRLLQSVELCFPIMDLKVLSLCSRHWNELAARVLLNEAAKAFHGGEEGEAVGELGMGVESVDEGVEGRGIRDDTEVNKIMEDSEGDRSRGGGANESIEEDICGAKRGAVALHGLDGLGSEVRLAETSVGGDGDVEEGL